ncbi:hypothetical protein CTAYLR_010042 [Chrysophaeum taylorii]|uniref:NADP-dependent glyceraldehyde-3-phosphate dehydrogenase n=1 Tax=Chrysophaeum taylorii TaxID=2483200 RepID=A0AAD7U993_9STRA|nr:hypothetical protein CTAYLR_010042 [Chrysophaeum taylorii]
MATFAWEEDASLRSVADESVYATRPFVDGSITFVNGLKRAYAGEIAPVTSPIRGPDGKRVEIGTVAHMTAEEGVSAVDAAFEAFGRGQGTWPRMALGERVAAVEHFMATLLGVRDEIINVLMWEICKNTSDATKEFDRTMDFVKDVLEALKRGADVSSPSFREWTTISGVTGKVRRGPIGVCVMVAAFNYPLNEMYAMMLPALVMGNAIVLKLPTIGGLSHVLTADALAAAFPKGVVNFVTGSGRSTLGPIMGSGKVDMVGLIGGRKACDALVLAHPEPHRLKVFSQLEGKNYAVVLPSADLDNAVNQVISGTTSYNGQRCTAIKLVLLHESISDEFVTKYVAAVKTLKVGLPWHGAAITPLPDEHKPAYLGDLVADALSKGSKVVSGGSKHHTLVVPTVLYPVSPDARAFQEEQFGPVVPISTFSDVDFVLARAAHSWNGQQIAVFCSGDDPAAAKILDNTQAIVGRININTAPSRGPDQFPFSARRSSALGTMSVTHAIEAFSIETILAFKENQDNRKVATYLEANTNFFKPTT